MRAVSANDKASLASATRIGHRVAAFLDLAVTITDDISRMDAAGEGNIMAITADHANLARDGFVHERDAYYAEQPKELRQTRPLPTYGAGVLGRLGRGHGDLGPTDRSDPTGGIWRRGEGGFSRVDAAPVGITSGGSERSGSPVFRA